MYTVISSPIKTKHLGHFVGENYDRTTIEAHRYINELLLKNSDLAMDQIKLELIAYEDLDTPLYKVMERAESLINQNILGPDTKIKITSPEILEKLTPVIKRVPKLSGTLTESESSLIIGKGDIITIRLAKILKFVENSLEELSQVTDKNNVDDYLYIFCNSYSDLPGLLQYGDISLRPVIFAADDKITMAKTAYDKQSESEDPEQLLTCIKESIASLNNLHAALKNKLGVTPQTQTEEPSAKPLNPEKVPQKDVG